MNVARLEHQLKTAELELPKQVRKRNEGLASFDVNRIERAVQRCYDELGYVPAFDATEVTRRVAHSVAQKWGSRVPNVEDVQDIVEMTLLTLGEYEAAKCYILYRSRRAETRTEREVPDEVRAAFEHDKRYFKTSAQQFMFYDKYSRYNWDLGRRETWHETVTRTVDHLRWEVNQHSPGVITDTEFQRIFDGILNMQVMPSMRLLAMAGEAARRNSMSLYNCSYMPVQDVQSFVEAMLVSMAGCGVGFSVEREYVEKFPRVRRQRKLAAETHFVEDSTEGWAEALRIGLEAWFDGRDVKFDYSGIRPAGAVLRIKGGRASGPEPLRAMLNTLRAIMLSRQGLHLRTTDAHLMMCWVGEAAVQGGMRRTAMISLFDWDDMEMRAIKNGLPPELAITHTGENVLWNANNSAVWPEDIADLDIAEQLIEMARARSGEPGIFSRTNAIRTKPKRRKAARFGTNPCGEIILRPFGFCNLSQAIARPGDTEDTLREKVEVATLIGVIQSLSTRFPGLRPEWKQNCEDERLLGVDLTAQTDCELLQETTDEGRALRKRLADWSVEVSSVLAARLGVNPPASNTCNKPAGNSAEFVDAANGIHRRKSRFSVRRYTVGTAGPLFRVLRDALVPMEPRAGSNESNATKWVASFLKKAPDASPLISDATVVDQLDYWLMNKEHWTEHNPSCTITYKSNEIIDTIKWVVDHKDRIGGLSFFPASDARYEQAPFEEIDEETYDRLVAEFPEIDYALLYAYEKEDMTTAAQELACFAGDGTCTL